MQIYLFGSYANDSYTDESDLDFYIVVQDSVSDLAAETTKAYRAIRRIKQRPVDIVVGRKSRLMPRSLESVSCSLYVSIFPTVAGILILKAI